MTRLDLFGVGARPWPAWYRPSKARATCNARVMRGLHPNGLPLGPEGSTCGGCALLVVRQHGASVYAKCPSTMGDTRGAATDMVRRWRGCERWTSDPAMAGYYDE